MPTELGLNDLCARIRQCDRCRLRATCTQVVPGEGSASASVMYVGEGPGEEEDSTGRPFVGHSGQYLRETLRQTEVDQVPYYITNTVRCRPPDNRTPNPDECAACWQWTEEILRVIRPRVIVTLGRPALATLSQRLGFYQKVGQNGIIKLAGIPMYIDKQDIYIYPMFHPAHALRRMDARAEFYGHAEYLRVALPGWLRRPLKAVAAAGTGTGADHAT